MSHTIFLVSALLLGAGRDAGKIKERVHLVLTGGPNAGTHEAETTEGGCSHLGNAWGNQLSSAEGDPKKFNSLQLLVDDARAAASGTDKFLLTVAFGPLLHQTAEYTVDTRGQKGKGSGKIIIRDQGKTATVLINATTADGVKIEATIDCKSVFVMDEKGNIR